MKDLIVQAKLKHFPNDFIVEEIGEKWDAKISEEFIGNIKPIFGNLEMSSDREFLWCELEKKDIDHFSTLKEICMQLGKRSDDIGYAGTKDKKAWTSQRVSIFHPNMEKLAEFSHPNIILKNFKWNKRKIKIGYLNANHFRIILRDIDKKDAIKISKQIRSLKWFPNYFGPQRFGSQRGNNVKIGKLILKRKFKEAVEAILFDMGNEREDICEARLRLRREKDFIKALEYFPHYLKLETQVLNYLARNPEDYLGALKRAERKNMLMFINSVQSKIFNDILEIALEEGLDFTKKGQTSCLLVGYKTRFFDGRLGDIERMVIKNHNIELSDFDMEEIGYLSMKGSFRKAVTEIDNLEVECSDDEEFVPSKKLSLAFDLTSGVYATTFLENFFIFDKE